MQNAKWNGPSAPVLAHFSQHDYSEGFEGFAEHPVGDTGIQIADVQFRRVRLPLRPTVGTVPTAFADTAQCSWAVPTEKGRQDKTKQDKTRQNKEAQSISILAALVKPESSSTHSFCVNSELRKLNMRAGVE